MLGSIAALDNAPLLVEVFIGEKIRESGNRDAILGDISRAARTALSDVIGYSEMLTEDLRERVDADTLADLTRIHDAGETLLELVAQLEERIDVERRHARIDPLTGVFNRRHFDEACRLALTRASDEGQPMALALLDLDGFKAVNDSRGHVTGDEVLRAVAMRCARVVRDGDVFARYGGEEFAVLLPGASVNRALIVAERLRTCISDDPIATSGEPVGLTISVGVAVCSPRINEVHELVQAADLALYEAKRTGRNRVLLHSEAHAKAS